MFERFTGSARQVVVLAQGEARAFGHNYIGTEHLLLGLLRERHGLAAQVLASLDVTAESVRDEVVRIVGRGGGSTAGQMPFTPRAKKVLELALREALSLGCDDIGTEHVLLGLVRENGGVAAAILEGHEVGPERVRSILAVELGIDPGAFAAPIGRRRRRSRRLGRAGVGGGQASWEYRIEKREFVEAVWLDELGADGWELVSVRPEARALELIFKRRRFSGALRAAG